MSKQTSLKSEFLAFASMIQSRSDRNEFAGLSMEECISKLFSRVHDARDMVKSQSDISSIATDIALIAMNLVKLNGKLDTVEPRRDSTRVIDARKHAVRDSSHKHAVVHHDKTVLWGAKLEADFEITDESLRPCMSSIRAAMQTLHVFNIKVDKIQIANGFVKVFPEDGTTDPRHADIGIPISPEL